MADCPIEQGSKPSYRCLLETALQCLDQAGLHVAAAHVDMALMLYEKQEIQSFKGQMSAEGYLNEAECLPRQQDHTALASAISTNDIELLYWSITNEDVFDEVTMLRKAHDIASSHRPASAEVAAGRGNARMFQRFLDAGACESAALNLFEPGFSYTVSRGAARAYRASVVIPGTDRDVSAEGATFATALVAAYLAALLAV